MSGYDYFAVITGDPYYADEGGAAFFRTLDRAVTHRDSIDDDAARVYVLRPVSESAHWDWSVDYGDGRELHCYVTEQAARNSRYAGGVVVRRRVGTSAWMRAPEGDSDAA